MTFPDLEALLDRLQGYVASHPARAHFAPPASDAGIAAVEEAAGVPLPPSYRRFLTRFDGGFVALTDATADATAGAEWNSNVLFGTGRLLAEHRGQRDLHRLDLGWAGPWPYLPFCHTDGQELLVFAPPASREGPGRAEPAVLDAWHEVGPAEWRPVYPDFPTLLRAYLDGEGRIRTVPTEG